jgi:bacillolysin
VHGTRTTTVIGVTGLLVAALALASVPAQAAPATLRAGGSTAVGGLAPTAARSDSTPGPRVLTTRPDQPLARPSGLPSSASPAAIAKAVVTARAADLGVRGALRTGSVSPALGGGSVVRLEQTFDGVPVIGGEVVVDVDPDGRTRSAISETLSGPVPSTTAQVTRASATATIAALVAKHTGRQGSALTVETPTLALYDAALLGAPSAAGTAGARLVWQAEVTSAGDLSLRRLVLLDAVTSTTVLNLDLVTAALHREVCDHGGAPAADFAVSCTSGNAVRSEGDAPVTSPADVDDAYDFAGLTYAFYATVLGRDSIDDDGMALRSTVRYCFPTVAEVDCPLPNAFWNGTQMVYGTGFASADDIVGHELTHGVTEHLNGLYYYFQSGAINESLSDIFGEYVDLWNGTDNLSNGRGDDASGVRWLMGEDLATGAIRSMSDPPAYNDPDSTQSPHYKARVLITDPAFDHGGVHQNSGVGNKFAYLLTDGDVFRGVTVTGIGVEKAARIVYGASQRMTSATDYRGFAAALRASCSALTGSAGIDGGDCAQVEAAIDAVAMDIEPVLARLPRAGYCPTGQVLATRFSDTMELPSSGRWVRTGDSFVWSGHPASTPLWFYATDPNPTGGSRVFASGGVNNLWGMAPEGARSDHQMAMAAGIPVPAGTTYLRFEHAFGFESLATDPPDDPTVRNFDGGVVEYTTDGGSTWRDAGPMMSSAGSNGYGFNYAPAATSTIATGFGNPLAGRKAFTSQSQGYVASRADISSLAGKTVRFRFRIGTDYTGGDEGWFVDNVRIYSCVALLRLSTPPAVVTGPTWLTWPGNDRSGRTTTTYRIATAPFGRALSAYGSARTAPSSRVLAVPLTARGTTCVSVTSRDLDTSLTSSAARCVTLPVDDRSMKASRGWTKVKSAQAFGASLRVATTKGRTLKLAGARGGHVTVLARAVKKGGKVGVYVSGRRIATITLSAARPKFRRFDYRVPGLVGATVKLKVLSSGRPVTIDAVAVRP